MKHGRDSLPPILEILIPSIPERAAFFLPRLLRVLDPQIAASRGRANRIVDVSASEDNGGYPIGARRNQLVNAATAKYTVFIDDDDLVSVDYVPLILAAIDRGHVAYTDGPDVIGIEGLKINEDGKTERIIQSLQFHTRSFRTGAWLSYPTHLNPVRLEIAAVTPFPTISFGEDGQYSKALRPKLKTEVVASKRPIYFYEYRKIKKEKIK